MSKAAPRASGGAGISCTGWARCWWPHSRIPRSRTAGCPDGSRPGRRCGPGSIPAGPGPLRNQNRGQRTGDAPALPDDRVAAKFGMAAVEPLQKDCRPGDLLLRAARLGQDDPRLAAASRECFAAADSALGRLGAPAAIRDAVAAFADRYV